MPFLLQPPSARRRQDDHSGPQPCRRYGCGGCAGGTAIVGNAGFSAGGTAIVGNAGFSAGGT